MQNLRTITLEIPLFDTHDNRFNRIRKIHEELGEVAQEACYNEKVNVGNLLLESMDVIQAAVGLTYDALLEIMSQKEAVVVLEDFLYAVSDSHNEKIKRYAKERGWSKL